MNEDKLNWNEYIEANNLNTWHKVDKDNFVPPKDNTTMILFFTKSGNIYCGYYKNSGFVCYGIGKQELTDVEVTHWRNLDFPVEYQEMLDSIDK